MADWHKADGLYRSAGGVPAVRWFVAARGGPAAVYLTARNETEDMAPVAEIEAEEPLPAKAPVVIVPVLLTMPVEALFVSCAICPTVWPATTPVSLMLVAETDAAAPVALIAIEAPRPRAPGALIVPVLVTVPVLLIAAGVLPPLPCVTSPTILAAELLAMLVRDTEAMAPVALVLTEAPSPDTAPVAVVPPVLEMVAPLVECWVIDPPLPPSVTAPTLALPMDATATEVAAPVAPTDTEAPLPVRSPTVTPVEVLLMVLPLVVLVAVWLIVPGTALDTPWTAAVPPPIDIAVKPVALFEDTPTAAMAPVALTDAEAPSPDSTSGVLFINIGGLPVGVIPGTMVPRLVTLAEFEVVVWSTLPTVGGVKLTTPTPEIDNELSAPVALMPTEEPANALPEPIAID